MNELNLCEIEKEVAMGDSDKIAEIMISAFVDNQLDSENHEDIIRAMQTDAILRDEVYQIRRLKNLMTLSYMASDV